METFKRIGYRFLRGFVAGAVGSMSTLLVAIGKESASDLKSLQIWGASLFFSAIVGGTTGGIMALDKYFRME
jgi:hypothetical protein